MSVVDLARPEIAALAPYEAAAQVDNTVRLNANESPATMQVGDFRRPLNRYPEVRPQKLQAALAARFECNSDQVLVTRGSSEAIDLLIRTFCEPGSDSIVTPSPYFSMYKHYATIQGARFIEIATRADRDFEIDIPELIDACDETARLLFVCSPNNPTGTPLKRDALLQLLESRRNKSVVVVDEAYIEFGEQPSAVGLIQEFDNLVVLRTLSKALGFAGARCGAAISTPDISRILSAVQAPYALATPVVECVEDALHNTQLEAAGAVVQEIVRERERLAAELSTFAFVTKVWPSDANFLLLRVADASAFTACCERHRILVRQFSHQLADCIRITVGSTEENNSLLNALAELAQAKQ